MEPPPAADVGRRQADLPYVVGCQSEGGQVVPPIGGVVRRTGRHRGKGGLSGPPDLHGDRGVFAEELVRALDHGEEPQGQACDEQGIGEDPVQVKLGTVEPPDEPCSKFKYSNKQPLYLVKLFLLPNWWLLSYLRYSKKDSAIVNLVADH